MKIKFSKIDIVITVAVLAIGLFIGAFVLLQGTAASQVVVTQDGVEIGCYPLNEDLEQRIATADGSEYNILQIAGGRACMLDASCPDQLCVKMGYISHAGQSIICLPHKLVISIEGDDSEYDAMLR